MKNCIPFLLLFITTTTFCQPAKVHSYYDRLWKRVENASDARYYRLVEKTNGGYHVKDYYMSGALQSEIFCTGITPQLQFDSELTLYHENGKPAQVGRFKDEKPYGVHQFFYEDGTKKRLVNYQDKELYLYQVWSTEGDPLLTNGSGSFEEPNELYGTVYNIVKDSVLRAMFYKVGVDTIFASAEKNPEYPGGIKAMQKDLQSNLKYPKSARKSKVEGRVYVGFIVNKKGEVKDCTILRGVAPDVDAAALQGVSMLGRWVPATYANRNVNFRYVIPIRFDLKGWWFW